MLKVLPFLLAVLLLACGPSGGEGEAADASSAAVDADPSLTPDGGGGGESFSCGDGPALDAGWVLTNVSLTTQTMGFHGRQGFLNNGERWSVWSEVAVGSGGGDMDIQVGQFASDAWTHTPLTESPGVQNTWPDMAGGGSTLHLVWNGRPDADTDNDIYMSRNQGAGWSLPVDLTTPAEGDRLRLDYRPAAALAPDGTLVVAYLSGLYEGDQTLGTDVSVVRVSPGGDVGVPVIVIDGTELPCSDVSVAVDDGGKVHVVAACGPFLSDRLVYATDASGDWDDTTLNLTGSGSETAPRLRADGGDIHLAFRSDISCTTGVCAEIFYAKRTGASFATAVNISSTPDVKELAPALGVDAHHRPVIAWSAPVADGNGLFVSYCQADQQFAAPRNLSVDPDSEFRDEPTHVTFFPGSSFPVISFNRVIRSSSPLNVEIYSAEIPVGGED